MKKTWKAAMLLGLACAGILPSKRGVGSNQIPDTMADPVATQCNGCTSAQVQDRALSLGHGSHYLYDLSGNRLYLFSVECEPIPGGATCYADSEPPAPSMLARFNDYRQAWQSNLSEAFKADVNYYFGSGFTPGQHDDGYVNAYDTITTGAIRNQLTTYLQTAGTYTNFVSTIIELINNSAAPQFGSMTLVVTVHFHDGSRRKFEYVLNHDQFEPIAGTAIDADGNPLPEDHPQGPRTYVFHDPPRTPYGVRNVAVLLSVPPPDIHETYYQCDWDGQTLSCRTVH